MDVIDNDICSEYIKSLLQCIGRSVVMSDARVRRVSNSCCSRLGPKNRQEILFETPQSRHGTANDDNRAGRLRYSQRIVDLEDDVSCGRKISRSLQFIPVGGTHARENIRRKRLNLGFGPLAPSP